jgi:6-phosphogluconolactonase
MKTLRTLLICAAALVWALPPAVAQQSTVYIGTYTRGASKGIYAYRFDAASGKLTPIGLAAETPNPSFLALSPNGRFLYAVNEADQFQGEKTGGVSAFAIDRASGKLKALNAVSSRGTGPCHLVVDGTGKCVIAANYNSGSVASFPVREDGSLGAAVSFEQHSGSSANAQRQAGPHAHSTVMSPDNRFVLSADLGLDEIFTYRLDPAKAAITPADPPFVKVAPGSGPRHLAFHPNGKLVYAVEEIVSKVTAFTYDSAKGSLREIQTISMLPADFTGRSTAAEIEVHSNGKFLYASNRGHDSIAVYSIDAAGKLALVTTVPSNGKAPRNFAIDPTGGWMLAANQDAGGVSLYKIDQKTGKLERTGDALDVAFPVCVTFLKGR